MTKLIIVRHAQSESNQAHFYAAATNVNLTYLGKAQAEETAKLLKDTHIDVAYCSDLVRVIQTAKPIVRNRDIPFILTRGLREINGGGFEGLTYDEIAVRYPYEHRMWYDDILNCYCPSGESMYDLFHRVAPVFDEIINNNRGKTILVATHACVLRVMMTRFLGLDFSELNSVPWVPNASVTEVDIDDNDNYTILKQGYNKHIADADLSITVNT